MRLSAERGAETQATESPDLAQTIFIPPTPGTGAKAATVGDRRARPPAVDPAGMASMASEPGTSRQMVTGQSRMSTWLLIAAVAIAAVALAVALTGRVGKSGSTESPPRRRSRRPARRRGACAPRRQRPHRPV